jgi:putative pyruvate formate lyase activating enzyme
LQLDERGIATHGLLVRHLILPNNLAGSDKIIRFLSHKISPYTYLNLMDQYRPEFKSHNYPNLNRRINTGEYQQVIQWADEAGLTRLDKR